MPETGAINAIVLAAGMSRRLGRPKQLLDVDGKPLVRHVVERCLASMVETVFVVVGHEAPGVIEALANLRVRCIPNPDYAAGQASSLIAGLDHASGNADAVVIALADQPFIETGVIDGLVEARRSGGASIAMAHYGEQPGHPVLFGREVFAELRDITGDQGGREVIRRHRHEVVLVPGRSLEVPLDVDTEEAYQLLLTRHARKEFW